MLLRLHLLILFSAALVLTPHPIEASANPAPETTEEAESPLEAVRAFRAAILEASSLGELAEHVHPGSEWRAEFEDAGGADPEELQEWQEYFRPYEPAEERIFGDSAVVLAFDDTGPGALVFVLARDGEAWRITSPPEPEFELDPAATGSFEVAGAVDAVVEDAHARIGSPAAWITVYDTFRQHLAGGFGQMRVPSLVIAYPACPEVGTHELGRMIYMDPDADEDGAPEQFAADPNEAPAVLEIESVADGRFSGTVRGALQPFQTSLEDALEVRGTLQGIPVHCPAG